MIQVVIRKISFGENKLNFVCVVGYYYAPNEKDYDSFLAFTKNLPAITKPGVFGLHDNADITKDQQETNTILDNILKTQVR